MEPYILFSLALGIFDDHQKVKYLILTPFHFLTPVQLTDCHPDCFVSHFDAI